VDFLDPSKADVVQAPEGTLRLWRPAPGLLVTQVEGLLLDKASAVFETMSRRIVAENGKLLGFHDWENMTDYESGARVRLTDMGRAFGRHFEGATFLVKSKLVSLGLQVTSVTLSGLSVAPNRAVFEAELREAIRSRKGRDV